MLGSRKPASRSTASGPRCAARRMALLLLSGLTFASAMPVITMAHHAPAVRPLTRDAYADYIAEASRRFGVPIAWIRAVMRAESAGEPRAVSSAGAMGLMQIMPATWAGLRARHGLGRDPYDPRDNILAGTAYLRELHDRYGSPGFLAAYNAGPGRYEASLGGRPLPAETRAYVALLAPVIDGSGGTNPTVMAAIDRSAWTRAPLFIAQSGRARAVTSVSAERPANDTATTNTARDVSAIVPQSNGLFVARASSEEPR
ncbi:lytic transglycosylase domain-containing protein [Ensifer adhaerens]|uniref:lytic transglycosylase domain-containing protein n=1 Tax=Ensifer adhaerens TaxID=106592 RepID=UPI001CBD9023|nr:lytic transglycosylase domain-containing protein [Ensifer adhaerens]MBZ7921514.1 lytic transglycosylase domain-containing protein [Ensifer adhaerens]